MAKSKLRTASKKRKTLTAKRLREVLHYNSRTGIFRWRSRAGTYNPHNGKVAGAWKPPDRITITVDSQPYYAHQLAWLYVYGRWPKKMVEPKNGCGTDNRIANLRAADEFTTKWKARRNKRNKSGHKGVFHVGGSRRPWRAIITHKKAPHYLGVFATKAEARAAYQGAAMKLRGKHHRPD